MLYKTIMADPPWPERGAGTIKRGADRHYELMKVDDICKVKVPADINAHLYLWVTNNFLEEGLRVLYSWGFRYITTITWVKMKEGKVQRGLGQYFRGATEHCLFGMRGNYPYRKDVSGKRPALPTVIISERRAHSEKPIEIYEYAESVSYEPRVELFARQKQEGWDAIGLETDGTKL